MLNSRKLFKRIAVLSFNRSSIWQKAIDFRAKRTFEDMVALEEKFQELIVDYIKNLSERERKKNTLLTSEKTDAILALDRQKKIIVLVDVPLENRGSSIDLQYLPESERHDLKEEWLKPADLEQSTFWTQLHGNFLKYVGKVRIFAHPDICDVLSAAIDHSELEKLLDRAMQYVIGKK